MSINSPSDITADLQIAPTEHGMVRLYVSGRNIDVPMDFTPDEAREIAAELVVAADMASKLA